MFSEYDTAKLINDLMIDYQKKISDSMSYVRENCSEKEIRLYRVAVGKVLGYMLTDIMRPIYEQHPDLKPKELDKLT